jgi:hypothetical protein
MPAAISVISARFCTKRLRPVVVGRISDSVEYRMSRASILAQ